MASKMHLPEAVIWESQNSHLNVAFLNPILLLTQIKFKWNFPASDSCEISSTNTCHYI